LEDAGFNDLGFKQIDGFLQNDNSSITDKLRTDLNRRENERADLESNSQAKDGFILISTWTAFAAAFAFVLICGIVIICRGQLK